MDPNELAELLVETEAHHGDYEPTAPPHRWADWYAAYIVARQGGATPPEAVSRATEHVEAVLR